MESNTNQEGSYFCSSCHCYLQEEKAYKAHYKSEFHRYNIKRKLLDFAPVTYEQYIKRKNSISMKRRKKTKTFYILIEIVDSKKVDTSQSSTYKCDICRCF